MIVRLVQKAIEGSPEDSLEEFLSSASTPPVPDVVVLPELFTVGYVLDRIPSLALEMDELEDSPVSRFASENGVWTVAGTFPVRSSRGIVNLMPVYSPDGSLVYTTEKVHLFRQMGEDRAFAPGSCGGTFPMNDTLAGGIVCYDLRFPELARRLTLAGAEILFVPAQWPSGRIGLFKALLRARAAEAQVFVAGCNLGGSHLGVSFKGGGGIAHPAGRMIKGDQVVPGVTDYSIDPQDVDRLREKIHCLEDRRPEEYD